MKKNLLSISVLLCLFAFGVTSCNNDFDAKIYGQLSTDKFPATEKDYESYLMDCYVPFSVTWGYGFNSSSWQHNFYVAEGGLYRMLDDTSDESASWTISSWGGSWSKMSAGQFDDLKLVGRTSGSDPSDFDKVRDITRFTQIIGTLEDADTTVLPKAKKEEFLGEARLCRGLMMYYLLHYYGPVPVIVDPAKVNDEKALADMERPTLDQMTQYITDDLVYACQHVAETQSEKGRYTADYARFCLMRHYLNEGYHESGYYQKAYDLFSQFYGHYSLFTSGTNPYADQFKIANKFNCEAIMACSCNSNATGAANEGNFNPTSWYVVPGDAAKYDDKGDPTPFVNQGGGWGQCFNISKYFYDTFEPGDKRAETILTSYYSTNNGWVTSKDLGNLWNGYIINKYPIETATSFQGTDYPLARWADVLLMYAEADVRAHNTVSQSAIDCVNQVRHRAGLEDLDASKTSSVSAFLDALLTERGHELFYEGCRKIDLIRFGQYYTRMKASGRTPSSEYFPIPDYAVKQAQENGYTLTQYFTRDNYDGPKI
ncbi:MAG: RagB/SusD family nutrient uptake outer membrane protein [Prevotella sp.]|jgi:hypothetical protein|nr:RagB/SusD family nutrient uptake outer membrane protein [Prevotella sp.]